MIRIIITTFFVVLQALTAQAENFPLTIKHALGETRIDAAPKRVVSLGRNDQDFLYALGVAPVAVREWWGAQPYATWPWAEDERAALSAEPNVLTTTETNIEWVAQQQPDLIVAIYEDLSDEQYALLSQIAPVVIRPEGYAAWRAPWQEQLRQTALAVTGTTDAAEKIIADLSAKAASIREDYPILEGKSATLADYRAGQVTVWSSDHAPTRFLISLGMTFPEELDELADESGWVYISPEQLELIELDAVIWPNGHKEALEDLAVYRQLRLSKEGRSVHLPGSSNTLAAALWFQTPLSLSYAMEQVAPLFAAALDGDPATTAQIPD